MGRLLRYSRKWLTKFKHNWRPVLMAIGAICLVASVYGFFDATTQIADIDNCRGRYWNNYDCTGLRRHFEVIDERDKKELLRNISAAGVTVGGLLIVLGIVRLDRRD